MAKQRAVLVTTEFRGVFFGYLVEDKAPERVALKSARCCLYWPSSNKGFVGLATFGPMDGSRVGPPADIDLFKITSILVVTDEAVKRWESAPW